MKAQSLINELRYHLGDLGALGYPDALLIEYINDGLRLIYDLKPEDFAVSLILPAQPGSVQCVNACCDRLVSVDALCDACGNTLEGVRQVSVKTAEAFNKAPINRHLYAWTLRDIDPTQFIVHPPIQTGQDVHFRITCTCPPDAVHSIGDALPDKLNSQALLHYCLYRAYAVESDSQSSSAQAQIHYQNMMQLLTGQRQIDRELHQDNRTP